MTLMEVFHRLKTADNNECAKGILEDLHRHNEITNYEVIPIPGGRFLAEIMLDKQTDPIQIQVCLN